MNKSLIFSLLWFLTKTLDQLSTELLGGVAIEKNPFGVFLFSRFSVYGVVTFHFLSALLIYFILYFLGRHQIIRDLAMLIIGASFIVALHNFLLLVL